MSDCLTNELVKCGKCGNRFTPSAHQVRKNDFICPPCRRERDAAWRARRKAEGNPVKQSKSKEWFKAYRASYNCPPKTKQKVALRRANSEERRKIRARRLANKAILRGKLHRLPCRDCGEPKTHAHHPDYDRPLEVIWLCPAHHRAEHGKA